ncbi:hypothetical protein GWI34_05570 [Actinomadura sp. DSM 109109]|nr:hypothetical protein [Actinomadura lepetitiana]
MNDLVAIRTIYRDHLPDTAADYRHFNTQISHASDRMATAPDIRSTLLQKDPVQRVIYERKRNVTAEKAG